MQRSVLSSTWANNVAATDQHLKLEVHRFDLVKSTHTLRFFISFPEAVQLRANVSALESISLVYF